MKIFEILISKKKYKFTSSDSLLLDKTVSNARALILKINETKTRKRVRRSMKKILLTPMTIYKKRKTTFCYID
jgi:hypothetical protein